MNPKNFAILTKYLQITFEKSKIYHTSWEQLIVIGEKETNFRGTFFQI